LPEFLPHPLTFYVVQGGAHPLRSGGCALTESDLGIREDDVTRVAQNAQEVKVERIDAVLAHRAVIHRVPAPSGAALRLKLGSSFSARARIQQRDVVLLRDRDDRLVDGG